MNDWRALTQAVARTMAHLAPGWTDRNDADPGITLLEMLAYLAEGLQRERGVVDDGSSAASRIIQALDDYDHAEPIVVRVNGERWQHIATLADAQPEARVFTLDEATGTVTFGDGVRGRMPEPGSTISARYRRSGGAHGNESIAVRTAWPLPSRAYRISLREEGTVQLEACVILSENWSGRKRPRFFSGRLLTVDDFIEEQQYHLKKHRRHLQTLHGSGIVQGLRVEAAGDTITIQPGLAIDGHGREIYLDEEVTLTVPSDSKSPAWIVVEYAERTVDPVPISTDGSTEASRIEEGCHVIVASGPCESGVAVARLIREQEGWHVDSSFLPARPG
jgi:hypothetical protein